MPDQEDWTDRDWDTLVFFIEEGHCAPFLGAGACAGVLPLGRELAQEWARTFNYPFPDSTNLARVAQFLAVGQNTLFAKLQIRRRFQGAQPMFGDPCEIHRMVADLCLPVYITTNYDDFLVRALRRRLRHDDVRQVVCSWHLKRDRKTNIPKELDFEPTAKQPVVYHLHGTLDDPQSMVLTEDDYLDFLIHVHDLMPSRIERAFTESSLLFLGYSLEDMNFKVLFRKLATYPLNEGARHVAVQLKPAGQTPTESEVRHAQEQAHYLQQQWANMKIKVFWGSCAEFARGLRLHWTARGHA